MSRKSSSDQPPDLTPEQAFGLVLRQRRLALGLTQADLEADTRIDRSYISQLENGKRQACLKTIIQLAFKLRMEPGELITEVLPHIGSEELQKLH